MLDPTGPARPAIPLWPEMPGYPVGGPSVPRVDCQDAPAWETVVDAVHAAWARPS